MRLPSSEKLEIICLVEQSHLPARRTLEMLGIQPSTFLLALVSCACNPESEGFEEKHRAAINGGYPPTMNRSAKYGARSSPHYGAKALLIRPSNQGVC
jgi:hypothetical protein